VKPSQAVQDAPNAPPHPRQRRQAALGGQFRSFLTVGLSGHEGNPFSLFCYLPEKNSSISGTRGDRPHTGGGGRAGGAGDSPRVALAVGDRDTALGVPHDDGPVGPPRGEQGPVSGSRNRRDHLTVPLEATHLAARLAVPQSDGRVEV